MSNSFLFISAGAGSGKTYRLTELLHEMLADGRVRPSGILATTFTNKAAAELRERVRSHLIKKGQFALSTAIGQARIGTVNSVCGNLLGRFAFEAGMPTEQRVLDESRADQLLREAIDEVIEGPSLTDLLTVARRLTLDTVSFGDGEDPWKVALRSIVTQARSNAIAAEQLRGFGEQNAVQLLGYFPKPTERELDKLLLQAIDVVLPIVLKSAESNGKANTAKYLKQLEDTKESLLSGHLLWSDWSRLATSEPEAALRAAIQPVKDIAGEHAKHPQLQQDVRSYLQLMFSLAADVLDNYRDRKRVLGVVDFTDQETELLKILDHPFVIEALSGEMDLLMVDEFQDTSPIQLALFLKLAKFAKHVVWVGDVKQAIYGFRGGDSALMTAVVDRLPELNAQKEVLPNSWRSRPSLVSFVNNVFGQAFDKLSSSDVELSPKREEFTGTPAVEDWQLEGPAADQHQGIASGIATLIRNGTLIFDSTTEQLRPVCFGDIAVLARSNNSVKAIAHVLQTRQITASTEQPGLLSRPEIILALACLRRLNDERDTIATAEIVSLADCEDPEVWLADRLTWIDSGAIPSTWKEQDVSVHPIFQAIKSLRAQRSLLSPKEAVQLIVTHCDLSRRVLQWLPSPERARLRLTNLDHLVDVASKYEDECRSAREAATLSGFLLWLGELAVDGADTLPQPAIDAVQIMTHHSAKGLEWPVVVLVDLAGDVRDSIWDQVRAESLSTFNVSEPLRDRFLRYWPWPYGGQKKVPIADDVETSAKGLAIRATAVEEHKRVLYVSMTRARDLLVLARSAKKLDGEWMSTVNLASHLPVGDSTSIVLRDGSSIPFLRRLLTPTTANIDASPHKGDLWWFQNSDERTEKLPLNVSPSLSIPVKYKVVETAPIGSRIAVARDVEFSNLGEAIHACLAAHLITSDQPLLEDEVNTILDRMGVSGAVAPDALLSQLHAVRHWLDEKWPGATPLVEVPIVRVLENGQRVNGRIDLLLRIPAGWILLDYKSSPQSSAKWEQLAESYGGQFAAYGEAIEAVTGMPVIEKWLVLPVAGVGLRVETLGPRILDLLIVA